MIINFTKELINYSGISSFLNSFPICIGSADKPICVADSKQRLMIDDLIMLTVSVKMMNLQSICR